MTRRSSEDRKRKREFRMAVVNRIRDLVPEERARVVAEIVKSSHDIPFSRKTTLSKATIYRWLKMFREDGNGDSLMGKKRSDRGEFKALTQEQKDALIKWRCDNAYRTAADLREELMNHETTCNAPPSTVTIVRFLRKNGLSRHLMLHSGKEAKIRLAFEAEHVNAIWMADTKGPDIYVIDPQNPSKTVAAKPIAIIDDYSRFLVAIVYCIVENQAAVMEIFCEAVYLFGICNILYVDRGSPYSGRALARAAALIGCKVLRAPKADPAAKGKIEKLLQTVHARFEQEMKASGKTAVTLEEYNLYLRAYVSQDYHRTVHSATGETPEERFFAFPPQLRRWISKDSLYLIFMPCKKSSVSKTGLIKLNNLEYLVPDPMLWRKKVEVRYRHSEPERVYVWYQDRYYGEAPLYTANNDFLQKQAVKDWLGDRPGPVIHHLSEVPVYSRLERELAQYRQEMESLDINEQLELTRQKRQQVRATLMPGKPAVAAGEPSDTFDANAFLYLLMKLLHRQFIPSERFLVHKLWNSSGPLEESLVRQTVGKLLGEERPTSDVAGYLEEIRLAVLIKNHN